MVARTGTNGRRGHAGDELCGGELSKSGELATVTEREWGGEGSKRQLTVALQMCANELGEG